MFGGDLGVKDLRGAATRPFFFAIPSDSTGLVWYPRSRSRVCCSLGGFGFLAFALLVFFLQSIHVSSEQVGVRLQREVYQ